MLEPCSLGIWVTWPAAEDTSFTGHLSALLSCYEDISVYFYAQLLFEVDKLGRMTRGSIFVGNCCGFWLHLLCRVLPGSQADSIELLQQGATF